MHRVSYKYVLLSLLLVLLAVVDVCSGSVFLSPREIIHSDSAVVDHVFFYLRLPKMLTAVLAGAALSVSGLMMQTLFRNPLAGPYILGVSSGAGLGVALVTMCGALLPVSIALSAIVGSVAVLLLVLAIARHVRSSISLLIVGMMIGAIAGALVNLVQNFSNPDALKVFIVWTFGSLSSVGWSQLGILAAVLSAGALISAYLMKPLNGLLLGENYARGLGINVSRVRVWIVVATGLLSGAVTAFCGPIAFVGVAVPHIARGWFYSSNHRLTMPAAALIGANLLLVCDILSSLFTYPLPISTMSALFGAPIIIAIILQGKK